MREEKVFLTTLIKLSGMVEVIKWTGQAIPHFIKHWKKAFDRAGMMGVKICFIGALYKSADEKQVLLREAVLQSGLFTMMKCANSRSPHKIFECISKTQLGKLNKGEVIKHTEDEFVFVIKRCFIYDILKTMGCAEATSMFCGTDNVFFSNVLPTYTFSRGKEDVRIATGHNYCLFKLKRRKEKEGKNH